MELHLSPRVIGKGPKGRTACGSAAYRNCSKIIDNDGNIHNFKYKKEWVAGGIELPAGASEELRNPQILWQRHEKNDTRKDAQLYRDIEFAVPNELSYEAIGRVAKGMAAKLTKEGMCVQWDVHDKYTWKDEDGNVVVRVSEKEPNKTYTENRNLHVHMMVTMRELKGDGTFGNKNRSWNKYNGGLNIADLLRPEAARLMNEELARIGSSERVEHESYAARGIDKVPTKHVGVAATAMERKGVKTNKGTKKKYVEWLNQIHEENIRESESLRQLETKTQNHSLEDLIAGAVNVQEGTETFKDWGALFALLRDTRCCRAAMRNEMKKLDKVIYAYQQHDEGYLTWAGCDPNNEDMPKLLSGMKNDLHLQIAQIDYVEAMLLDSKELYKAHNKVVYAAKKENWVEYQKLKKEQKIQSNIQRCFKLEQYVTNIKNNMCFVDVLLNTEKNQMVRSMEKERQELLKKNKELLRGIKQIDREKDALQKDTKVAQKAEEKIRRNIDWRNM